jgi:lysophospholipase L1-like esterase
MKKIFGALSFFLVAVFPVAAQVADDLPFASEINGFKKQDNIQFPKPNSIVFVGSSSFNFWKSMQQDFPEYPVINRGFGGSELVHAIMYANQIILPYKPKQVVIYSGENDLAVGNVPADSVLARFEKLFNIIRTKYPKVSILYVSIKPSPSRAQLMPEMVKANGMIRDFLKKKKETKFIDVYPLMLDAQGSPRKELFVEDMLHMNATGYAIWIKAIKPYLKK